MIDYVLCAIKARSVMTDQCMQYIDFVLKEIRLYSKFQVGEVFCEVSNNIWIL